MADSPNPAEAKDTRRRSLFSPRDKLKPVKAPPPPERPKRKQGGLIAVMSAVLTVTVIIMLVATAGIGYMKRVVSAPGPLQSERSVVIERGMGAEEIAEVLEREGVITSPTMFQALAVSKLYGSLKSGEFLFKREASLADVIDTIANGRAIEHNITIPEGLTSEQIVARLRESDLLVGNIIDIPPEGSLLPDTYKIARGASRDSLVARMQRDQKRLLAEVWNRRAKDVPLKSPSDLVILASVIEKETGKADERSRVAGVFVNRLNKNMRLQSDPTIVYGLVGGKGTLGRAITRADIQSNTPYNTYVINGLPPGPIANPGRASMEAAANPSRTRELFFVADGTGGHAFAETLEQHERNVTRWRQIEAQRDGGTATPGFGAVPQAVPSPAPSLAPGIRSEGAKPMTTGALPSGARDASEGTSVDPLNNRSFDLNSAQTIPTGKQPAAPTARQGFAPAPMAGNAAPRRSAADASAGTRMDPLNNKSFDLNSSKSVPALR